MVEVFKTNVTDPVRAEGICAVIRHFYPMCRVNFDLDDCDRILRVEFAGAPDLDGVLRLLRSASVRAEVLADEVPVGAAGLPVF